MASYGKLLRYGVPILIVVLILAVAIARVGAGDPGEPDGGAAPDDERQVQEITIEAVDVRIAESFPVQVFIDVTGTMPDPCWEAQEPAINQNGPRFEVEIMAERDPDEMCTQVIEDYQTNISLGSPEPGEYVVEVNGVEQEFEVQ